jgi:hypothetical protein
VHRQPFKAVLKAFAGNEIVSVSNVFFYSWLPLKLRLHALH